MQHTWINFLRSMLSLYMALMISINMNAIGDGLAKTPPMGWNSWNTFNCDINENLIKSIADSMVSKGLRDAGYKYIVIDDCWQLKRGPDSVIIADPLRFPSGMKALADYIHSKGLLFGVYSDAGFRTCKHRPGSAGYEKIDAKTYASWGVDYLKYDWCWTMGLNAQTQYTKMSHELVASGRPIVFSICEWGKSNPWMWAENVGHLWRTTPDIQDCWNCHRIWGGRGWTIILDDVADLFSYAGPGHWNDPDMLEVGKSMTTNEDRAHFSMWCMLAAPLIAGNDIRNMSKTTLEILTDPELISIDQDSLGIQASRIKKSGKAQVWQKVLKDGSVAVALLNLGNRKTTISVTWNEIGLENGDAQVRNVWEHQNLGIIHDCFQTDVPPHDVIVIKVKGKRIENH